VAAAKDLRADVSSVVPSSERMEELWIVAGFCEGLHCINCTLCKKIYVGETGRILADRFHEHLRDVDKNDIGASKPVCRPF